VVASDLAAADSGGPSPIPSSPAPSEVPSSRVEQAARLLAGGRRVGLLVGGAALLEPGARAAARIGAASGCRLFSETFPARMERGAGLPAFEKVPYFPDQALAALAGLVAVVLAGARDPVGFFGYPGLPSRLIPAGTAVFVLARPDEDAPGALEVLADRLGAATDRPASPPPRPEPPTGALSIRTLGTALAALQPDGTILVDEGNTSAYGYWAASAGAARSSYLANAGGAIGFGPPCATGAALACPDRRVIALQADGSAMYTFQSLWTQAREQLDVVTVLCSNRSYRILRVELERAGIAEPGPQAVALTDLSRPPIDWVGLARSVGVPAARVESADALVAELGRALAAPGPSLIEVPL
jgi:acetolactate synthase-1/2/3 large subunit